MSEQDFIDRETQLPADVRETPPDMMRDKEAGEAMRRAPAGEPGIDFDVRSVFDSRPVQGYDFNIIDTSEFAASMDLTFTVPPGFVAVVRKFMHTISNNPIVERVDMRAAFFVNGGAVRYNENLPIGGDSYDTPINLFFLADENSVVTARLTTAIAGAAQTVFGQFYGTFLAKTGRPYQFEIANPVKGGVATVTAPAKEKIAPQAATPAAMAMPRQPTPQPLAMALPAASNDPCTLTVAKWRSMSFKDRLRWQMQCGSRGAVRG